MTTQQPTAALWPEPTDQVTVNLPRTKAVSLTHSADLSVVSLVISTADALTLQRALAEALALPEEALPKRPGALSRMFDEPARRQERLAPTLAAYDRVRAEQATEPERIVVWTSGRTRSHIGTKGYTTTLCGQPVADESQKVIDACNWDRWIDCPRCTARSPWPSTTDPGASHTAHSLAPRAPLNGDHQ